MKGAEDAPLMGDSNGLIANTPGMKKIGDEVLPGPTDHTTAGLTWMPWFGQESGGCMDTLCTKLDKYSDVFAPLGWWDPIPVIRASISLRGFRLNLSVHELLVST